MKKFILLIKGHPEPFISRQMFKLLRSQSILQKKASQIVIDADN